MAVYTIRDLEIITGIKAHTIRVWERRYGLVKPRRTDTNIRLYSEENLKKLLNVSMLIQKGLKISKIAQMDDFQIRDRVLDYCMDSNSGNMVGGNLMLSMLEFDEARFSATLSESVINIGFESTVENVLFPFIERMGLLWQAGAINISQEHFISNLIRQKLQVAINNEAHKASASKGRILFFSTEHEWFDTTLLFYSYIARKEGFEVIYVGGSTPVSDLGDILSIRPYKAIFFSLCNLRRKNSAGAAISEIADVCKGITAFAVGLSFREFDGILPDNFHLCRSAAEFKRDLASI